MVYYCKCKTFLSEVQYTRIEISRLLQYLSLLNNYYKEPYIEFSSISVRKYNFIYIKPKKNGNVKCF